MPTLIRKPVRVLPRSELLKGGTNLASEANKKLTARTDDFRFARYLATEDSKDSPRGLLGTVFSVGRISGCLRDLIRQDGIIPKRPVSKRSAALSSNVVSTQKYQLS